MQLRWNVEVMLHLLQQRAILIAFDCFDVHSTLVVMIDLIGEKNERSITTVLICLYVSLRPPPHEVL